LSVKKDAPASPATPQAAPPVDYNKAVINGEVWDKVLDKESNEHYYWNRTTNAVQWTPPDGFPAPPAASPSVTASPQIVVSASPSHSAAVQSTPVSHKSNSNPSTPRSVYDQSPDLTRDTSLATSASSTSSLFDSSNSPTRTAARTESGKASDDSRTPTKMFTTLRKKKVCCLIYSLTQLLFVPSSCTPPPLTRSIC
jgi:hypothetical protein